MKMGEFDEFLKLYDPDTNEDLADAATDATTPNDDEAKGTQASAQPADSDEVRKMKSLLDAADRKAEKLQAELDEVNEQREHLKTTLSKKQDLEKIIADEEEQRDQLERTIEENRTLEKVLDAKPLPDTDAETLAASEEDADIQQKSALVQKRMDA